MNKRQKEILDALHIARNNEVITNPFTNVSVELNPTEVALYDFIKGCELVGNYKDFDDARYLFCELNPDAYSKLID
jgi:hypothetical protein